MTELDQIWSQMLNDAVKDASDSGRQHVADYLRLKATNDAIRELGVAWLFDTFIETAAQSPVKLPPINIDREHPHSFPCWNSTMVGSLLSIRRGVRCLNVEAGWARTPADGVMRNSALALARITHFGMPKFGAEIRLVHAEDLPKWINKDGVIVDSAEVQRHFDVFIGE